MSAYTKHPPIPALPSPGVDYPGKCWIDIHPDTLRVTVHHPSGTTRKTTIGFTAITRACAYLTARAEGKTSAHVLEEWREQIRQDTYQQILDGTIIPD